MTAILTISGRTALASSVRDKTLYLAIGRGNPAWGNSPPDPTAGTTALLDEIGRRVATIKQFVTPNPSGDIIVSTGERFSLSVTPTNHLHIRANMVYADGSGQTVREVGVFTDTVLDTGLPVDQQFFPPGDVANPGVMMTYETIAPVILTGAVLASFALVVTF